MRLLYYSKFDLHIKLLLLLHPPREKFAAAALLLLAGTTLFAVCVCERVCVWRWLSVATSATNIEPDRCFPHACNVNVT